MVVAGVPNVERGTKGYSGHAALHGGPLSVGETQVKEEACDRVCEKAKGSCLKSEVKDGPALHD